MEGGANPIGVEDDSINPEEEEVEEEEEVVEEEEVEEEEEVGTGKLLVDVGMMEMISTWILVPVGHSNLPHLEVQEVSVGLVEDPSEEDLRRCPENMMMRRRRDPDLDQRKRSCPCRRYT